MWYVEYMIADGSNRVERWEGLTKEQAFSIFDKNSGWNSNTVYSKCGDMAHDV
jgi:hypothetical protein